VKKNYIISMCSKLCSWWQGL